MKVSQFIEVGWYLVDERHRLKAADMRSNLVPMPAMLTRFRINKVDRPEYYEWAYEGVLALAGRRRTPPGVIVTTDCRTLDPHRLPSSAFLATSNGAALSLVEVPPSIRAEIERLAREWAGDRPRGWPQIEAVLAKLRAEYSLGRDATAPPDHLAPALWFLTESRRGPDYLFATAAALQMRSLGYPARVCLGYYVSPEAYDPETGHTHAFDDWTSPFVSGTGANWEAARPVRRGQAGGGEVWLAEAPPATDAPKSVWNRDVPGPVLGAVALLGLVVFSVVALYIYYPDQRQAFEEITRVRAEAVTTVHSGRKEEAIRQIQHWDLLTRKVQVGVFIRTGTMDAETGKVTEDLRECLEDLRDALLADNLARAKELLAPVEEAYRKCRSSYRLGGATTENAELP